MNESIMQGLLQASIPINLLATAIGSLLGLIIGMIPGMTISSGIIIVLPLTFVLEPDLSIAMLLGLYVSGMTGGSFSATLLNIPGTPSASATANPRSIRRNAVSGNPMKHSARAAHA